MIWLQTRAKFAGGHGTALARVARCPVRLRKSHSEQSLAAVPQKAAALFAPREIILTENCPKSETFRGLRRRLAPTGRGLDPRIFSKPEIIFRIEILQKSAGYQLETRSR